MIFHDFPRKKNPGSITIPDHDFPLDQGAVAPRARVTPGDDRAICT
jgi:hypothetical protein